MSQKPSLHVALVHVEGLALLMIQTSLHPQCPALSVKHGAINRSCLGCIGRAWDSGWVGGKKAGRELCRVGKRQRSKGRTIHEQAPTDPASSLAGSGWLPTLGALTRGDRPRFAGPEKGRHCRKATADRLLMSSRPGHRVRKGAAPVHDRCEERTLLRDWTNSTLTFSESESHLREHKLIYTTMQLSLHRHLSAPTAPSRTSDDRQHEAVPRCPTAQSARRYYLDRKYSSVLFYACETDK